MWASLRSSILAVALAGALGADPADAIVNGTPGARPLALPVPGRLLVEAPPFGLAIIAQDGRVTRLGDWYDAVWSPDGGRVAAIRGRTLAVVDDSGSVRWSERRAANAAPSQPDWAPDGRQLAYRDGRSLRVVDADGRHDHAVAGGIAFAGPRWRPGAPGELAWADRHGAVHVVDLAGTRHRWTSSAGAPVRPNGLTWSADGSTLAAISGGTVRIFDAARGALLRRISTTRQDHFQSGTFAGDRLVLVRHDFAHGTSQITSVEARHPGDPERTVLGGRGSVSDATVSPDGRWLLVGRRYSDEWQFWPLSSQAPPLRLDGVTRALNPQAGATRAFPATRGWRSDFQPVSDGYSGFKNTLPGPVGSS